MTSAPIGQLEDDYDQLNRQYKRMPIAPVDNQQPVEMAANTGPVPITANAPPVSPSPKPVQPAPIGNPKLDADQAELTRLQQTGSGLDQLGKKPGLGHKILSVLGRIGDVAGTALFPTVAAAIPGTTLHHDVLENRQAGRVADDSAVQKQQAGIEAGENSIDVRNKTLDLKTQEFENKKHDLDQKHALELSKHGFKEDENGTITPDPDSPITKRDAAKDEYLKVQTDLSKANGDLRKAQAEVELSKNNPDSPAYQLALKKLSVAQMNAESMGLRGRAAWANYLMHSQSVDEQGQVLPGAMLDDNNNAIGSTYSQNVRPTGTERSKADMARSAKDQIADMKDIVSRRPDIFGPAAGRKTDFTIWVGSQDPDAQKFRAARTIAGDHLAGTFGGRSEAALEALDAAIGHYKDNPKAIAAGLDQLSKANDSFIKAGTVATKGGTHDNSKVVEEYVRDPKTKKLVKK